jgi:exodeoxyribonuclease V alpha subunit
MTKASAPEQLQGTVERVTFQSEVTGFCVLRVQAKGFRELVTVVGSAPALTPGELIDCQGHWHRDAKYGLQFKANQINAHQPHTLEGIEKYLGSGMVKGIGPHFAKILAKAFGESVFEVIEQAPEKLLTLEGIGDKRQQKITQAWADQKTIRDIMVFLHGHGVGSSRAVRIYKTYGEEAIARVKSNPYRLAHDIRGIGFKTADGLAEKMGIPKDSLMRACAGVTHVLKTLCDQGGHCAVDEAQLMHEAQQLLAMDASIIQQALTQEQSEKRIQAETMGDHIHYYPMPLYQSERRSAERLLVLRQGRPPWGELNVKKAIPWVEQKTGLSLSASQYEALVKLMQHKVSIMTGGPGVGKTTLVNTLLWIIRAKGFKVSLCAPTGRAAKRLTETTRLTAKTIHRLLVFDPATHQFQHREDYPLSLDVLIIDEASMIDIVLFNQLLKAVPLHAAIIFVGDVDQLPSVGPGAVLSDLIDSGVISTVRLTEIFRQAKQSNIVINAHRINQGKMPLVDNTTESNDYFTLYYETPEIIQAKLIAMVTQRVPNYYDCDPVQSIQVLTPMHRGSLGVQALNGLLQQALNPKPEASITRFGQTYAVGDKVIQLVNNYDKDVFNGDIGFIQQIDLELGECRIIFDESVKVYETHELDELSLAYAISIHKSQGSEFPVVVMPLAMQHYMLLARNLLYTGLTRGRQLVILLAQKKAVGMAVHNNQIAKRLTYLSNRIRSVT